ncbi:hypothetical protein [Campylobacter magnus]|uniref:Uncharacterized protein n=1 Tax=Campylobacter magnus TaxID=3026462 RepID=A0ABT8T6T8_9BACT|nr:hypothetical protein [Campylobacter magnus]MDO2409206.1 hypothetical protein [Campylobacter magnus]
MNDKLTIEVNGANLEFSQNGDKIEFDIPQRALKLLCNYVYKADSSCMANYAGIYNLDIDDYEKELYSNGSLKSLTQRNHLIEKYGFDESEENPSECMAKYEFDENHKLTSFHTKYPFDDDKKEVTINSLSYFENGDEKRVKGKITGFDFGLEYIENGGDESYYTSISFKDFCDNHIDFFNIDVDVKEIEAGKFSLETNELDEIFELHYDNCGILNESFDGDGYGGLNGGENAENGEFKQYIVGENGNALEYIKNFGEENGFYKINMYYRDFDTLFWDIIDTEYTENENGDISSIDEESYENIIKIEGHKLFGFTTGWIEDDESDDYDADSYEIVEDDCLEEDFDMKYIKTIDLLINKNYFGKFLRYIIFNKYEMANEVYSPIVMF